MKKTAVQEVFIELEKLHPNLFDIYTEKGRQFVHHFHKFLDIEKEQIKDAYEAGYQDGDAILGYENFDNSESYYKKTYKNNDNA
jgi:hypothetical protein